MSNDVHFDQVILISHICLCLFPFLWYNVSSECFHWNIWGFGCALQYTWILNFVCLWQFYISFEDSFLLNIHFHVERRALVTFMKTHWVWGLNGVLQAVFLWSYTSRSFTSLATDFFALLHIVNGLGCSLTHTLIVMLLSAHLSGKSSLCLSFLPFIFLFSVRAWNPFYLTTVLVLLGREHLWWVPSEAVLYKFEITI